MKEAARWRDPRRQNGRCLASRQSSASPYFPFWIRVGRRTCAQALELGRPGQLISASGRMWKTELEILTYCASHPRWKADRRQRVGQSGTERALVSLVLINKTPVHGRRCKTKTDRNPPCVSERRRFDNWVFCN